MDWNTILSVFLGGVLATVPIIISNRFQAREREKDRQEQRQEEKAKLALELMRNDIRIIEDIIDCDLKTLDTYSNLRLKKERGKLTQEEMLEKMKTVAVDILGDGYILSETGPLAEKLLLSLGEEFSGKYQIYKQDCIDFLQYYAHSSTFRVEDMRTIDSAVYKGAAQLHRMLNEKLLSLRG